MNKFKKIVAALLLVTLVFAISGCAGTKKAKVLTNGTYTGEAEGKGGVIKVELAVTEGKISKIDVKEHHETAGIGDLAMKEVSKAIIENQSVNVDTISGATIACEGLLKAAKGALKQAGAKDEDFNNQKKVSLIQPEKETEQSYDVVIIGAGGAGLAAAVEAKQSGAKVVVLEKMPLVGGNTLVSGGGLNVPNSPQQKAKNIQDSVQSFYEDTLKGGDSKANPSLVKILAENALDASKWLVDYVKVEFMPDRLQQFGGHSVPRALIAKGNHGTELIEKLTIKAKELGVDFKMNTTAKELMVDEKGKIVGVKATNPLKQELTFKANKGVVMASGGFGSNVEMRKKYNPEFDEKYLTTDQPGTTGDGIIMAEKVGANLTQMDYIQTYPTCNPETGIISYVANSRFDGAILVNKEGKRFVEEMERRDVISKGILNQTDSVAYLLWGQEVEAVGNMTKVHTDEYNKMEKSNVLYKVNSIEEAAKVFKIDVDTMKATVERYNKFVAEGKDKDFNRRGQILSIEKGPFYIQKVKPSIHHTMGGIVIDENARVINKDGKPIEGLFAAGEVTGGIHGTNRLGGNAVTDVIVFGKIAGKNVVK